MHFMALRRFEIYPTLNSLLPWRETQNLQFFVKSWSRLTRFKHDLKQKKFLNKKAYFYKNLIHAQYIITVESQC